MKKKREAKSKLIWGSKECYTEVIDDHETGQRTVTIRRDEE